MLLLYHGHRNKSSTESTLWYACGVVCDVARGTLHILGDGGMVGGVARGTLHLNKHGGLFAYPPIPPPPILGFIREI